MLTKSCSSLRTCAHLARMLRYVRWVSQSDQVSPYCIRGSRRLVSSDAVTDMGHAAALRSKEILKEKNPFYQPFKPTRSIRAFREKYGNSVSPGSRLDEKSGTGEYKYVERIAGRVSSKREAGPKMFFMDVISSHGEKEEKIQVMCMQKSYMDSYFTEMNAAVKRGDIVGVEGVPAMTKVGELSIVPHKITILAPCLHRLPEDGHLEDPSLRAVDRPLDMIVNSSTRHTLKTRFQVIQKLRSVLTERDFIEGDSQSVKRFFSF